MANAALRAIRFWAYPATVMTLWVVVSALLLFQLATVLPSIASAASVQRLLQPRGCDDVC
ncbi:MAG: hypothetical protein E6J78_19825 [Deltaproteobacteria bacterium]|nr:MAG: hypothetical protein E6J78_19825 [Deltaproteobacteria bacterium]